MVFTTLISGIVRAIHIVIVLAALLTPFLTKRPDVLALHAICMSGMMVHWLLSSDRCVLTTLEAYLRGVASDKTFVFQILSPVYHFPITLSQQRHIIWTTSILLTILSMHRIIQPMM